ncbi:MAG: stage IV sporulation protein A [Clostridia bacterium]|nr:stage IV sporulation protein A [Clostridia bacterium]
MEEFNIYKDVKERTNGEIYVGVVGPVRTGKSTFITNFMNKTVIPKITSKHQKSRMSDELPQSANGNTVMTTQPKFVPSEAVNVKLSDSFDVKIRLVDCVGYIVEGASGHEENGQPRMVTTPWSENPIPFSEAATIGTQKVILEHSTVGVVMTTDGTIDTGIPRANYESAEERTVEELKKIGKPFVVVLNTKNPSGKDVQKLAKQLTDKYETPVIVMDVLALTQEDIDKVFSALIMEFPVKRIDFEVAKWIQALDKTHPLISELREIVANVSQNTVKMSDYSKVIKQESDKENFLGVQLVSSSLGEGVLSFRVCEHPNLFYTVLSSECGVKIDDEFELMANLKSLVYAKNSFDKIEQALKDAQSQGYGIVLPGADDTSIYDPQIEKKGGRYGVKIKAAASAYHIIKVDATTEVSPLMGAELQSEEMVKQLFAQYANEDGSWKNNMMGRPLDEIVSENIKVKMLSTSNEVKKKMRKALCRIVNEGKGGVICILL